MFIIYLTVLAYILEAWIIYFSSRVAQWLDTGFPKTNISGVWSSTNKWKSDSCVL